MGNGKSTPEVGGKKRKQDVEDGATPKRVRKEAPTRKSATMKTTESPEGTPETPTLTQKVAKGKTARRSSGLAIGEAAESVEQATVGAESRLPDDEKQGDASILTNKDGPPHRYTKRQWKQLQKGGTASPNPMDKPVDKPVPEPAPKQTRKPVNPPAPVKKEPAPLDELELQRRKAEKKARRKARKSDAHGAALQKLDSKDRVQTPAFPAAPTVAAASKKPKKPQEAKEPKNAVIKTEEQAQQSSAKWTLSDASAGRYINHDPVFVIDSNGDHYLVAATSQQVQVLSLETSLPAYALQIGGGATVVAFSREPDSSLISVLDSKRYLTTWDWEQGLSSRAKQPKNGTPLAYASSAQAVSKNESRTVRVTVQATSKITTVCLDRNPVYKTQIALDEVHITGDAQYIVAHGPDAILLGKLKNSDKEYTWAELPLATKVTCAHSELRLTKGTPGLRLVVGLANGQLHIYDDVSSIFNIKDGSKLPSSRVLHWHRDAVSSVKFSADGRYLISGGKETVLVLWQLETGKTQFLPHLTSEVERVVVSSQGDRYAVQMGDNSIMVLSTSELKPVANFAGLQLAVPVQCGRREQVEAQDTTVLLHPTQPDHLLLSVPATQPKSADDIAARPFLQAFDLRTSRHVVRQALTRNNVTDLNLGPEQTPIIPPDVCHAAISHDGQWLATVDEWVPPASDIDYLIPHNEDQTEQEQLKRKEVHLKIWQWDATSNLWTLTTRIDAPHARATEESSGAGSIYGLVASPTARGFATVGEDSVVKFWKSKARMRHGVPLKDEQGNELVEWTCRRTTQLERQLARVESPLEDEQDASAMVTGPSDAHFAFSEDGSTLAVAVCYDILTEAPALHLLDATTGEVKHVKDSHLAPDLAGLGFLDRHLIALSRESLRVWDIVSDSLAYEVILEVPTDDAPQPLLALNTRDRTFAIAFPQCDKKGKVVAAVEVYELSKPEPLHGEDLATPLCALLSSPNRRGYVLLFADATIRTLAPKGAMRTAGRSTMPPPPAIADTTLQAPEFATTAVPDLLLAARGAKQGLVLEEAEDDRPVVRPEDLAGLFDTGGGRALPNVRDMWRSVARLYSRKPRVGGAEGVAMEVDD